MPHAFLQEFRDDVVAVARRGEAPFSRIAKDFGVSKSCLQWCFEIVDVEDGVRPGVTLNRLGFCAEFFLVKRQDSGRESARSRFPSDIRCHLGFRA